MSGSPVADVRLTLGALFFGLVIYVALFGLTLGQTWVYVWQYWAKDSKGLKSFVAFITFLDVVLTVLTVYSVYYLLILNFGHINSGSKWMLSVQANLGAISATAIQLYYTRRIYVLTQNKFLPLLIISMLIIGNVIGFYVAAKQYTAQVNSRYISLVVFGYYGMGQTVLVDILIAWVMCWALYRNKTGIARTDTMIMTLMAYTINTGVMSSLLSSTMLISFIIAPLSLVPVVAFWVASRCYVNAVLAMLNSRDYVLYRSTIVLSTDNSITLSSIPVEPPGEAHCHQAEP